MLKDKKSCESISSISISIDVISASSFSKSNELLKNISKIAKCDAMNFWSEERFKEDRLCWTDVNKKKTRSWQTYDMTIKVHKRSDNFDQFNKILMKNYLNFVEEFELVRKIMSIEHDNIILNNKLLSLHIFLQNRIFFIEITTKNTTTNQKKIQFLYLDYENLKFINWILLMLYCHLSQSMFFSDASIDCINNSCVFRNLKSWKYSSSWHNKNKWSR